MNMIHAKILIPVSTHCLWNHRCARQFSFELHSILRAWVLLAQRQYGDLLVNWHSSEQYQSSGTGGRGMRSGTQAAWNLVPLVHCVFEHFIMAASLSPSESKTKNIIYLKFAMLKLKTINWDICCSSPKYPCQELTLLAYTVIILRSNDLHIVILGINGAGLNNFK